MTLLARVNDRDLIVIGGGSAGMAAAIRGALLGLKVMVFDPAGEDFDKPCGEGLMLLTDATRGCGIEIFGG
jgi:flavin-dependent dehydrogenase